MEHVKTTIKINDLNIFFHIDKTNPKHEHSHEQQ